MVSLTEEEVKKQLKNRPHGEHGWFKSAPRSYMKLLRHQAIKDWIDNYTAYHTRTGYLYSMEYFLNFTKLSPKELLQLSPAEAKKLLRRACQYKVQQGKHSMARRISLAIRGFFEVHGIEIKLSRRERIKVPLKKIHKEIIFGVGDVYKLAEASKTPRNKALLLSLWQSGVRSNCVCNWKFRHVKKFLYPEIQLPIRIKITSDLDSKISAYGLGYYYAFLTDPAATALWDYIEFRKNTQGWEPKDDDFLFVTWGTASRGKKFQVKNVWEIVKRAADRAGFNSEGVWTHILRKSFRKVLNAQPFDEDTKEALMGHRLPGSRGSYFDYHDIDEMEKKYMSIDWSRPGSTRLNHFATELRKTTAELEKLRPLKDQVENLSRQLEELQEMMRQSQPLDRLGTEKLEKMGYSASFKIVKVRKFDTRTKTIQVLDVTAFSQAKPGRSEKDFTINYSYKNPALEPKLLEAMRNGGQTRILVVGNVVDRIS